MKHLLRLFMTAFLFYSILTPVMAKTSDTKIVRETSNRLFLYEEVDGTQLQFEIGLGYDNNTMNTIQYYQFNVVGDIETGTLFTADLPDFNFPKKLENDFSFDQCVTGEDRGYWYNYQDGSYENWGPIEAEHCFALTLDYQQTSKSSTLITGDNTEVGHYFRHYKTNIIMYVAQGKFDDFEITDSQTSIVNSAELSGFPQAEFDSYLKYSALAKNDAINSNDFYHAYVLGSYNDYIDPTINPYRYIQIVDDDRNDHIMNIDIARYLFNESGQIIGTTQFWAEIPDSALQLSKDKLTATINIHAFGQSIDWINAAEDPENPLEPVQYDDDCMINITWHLALLYRERFIIKDNMEDFRYMSNSYREVYAGLVSGSIDGVDYTVPYGNQYFYVDHFKN